MQNHYKRMAMCLIAAFIPWTASAQFQWQLNGMKAASSMASQTHLQAVSDGNGGFFLTWENNQTGDLDIYAQWIDAAGNLRWGDSGVLVSSSSGDQKYPTIVLHGSGGALIAWQDELTDNIYAQRYNAEGIAQATPNGFLVCDALDEQTMVKAVTDGQNGAILVWMDKRSTTNTDLYAQRITDSGVLSWTANGVPVTTAAGNQSSHTLVSDANGGVIVAWQDYRSGYSNADIYAQRISSAGASMWTANGVGVVTEALNQMSPSMQMSGMNYIITWDDYRSDSGDIYAQSLDLNGNKLWPSGGVNAGAALGTQLNNRITPDGSGGAIIAWTDDRSGYNIYGQRLNNLGQVLWTSGGKAINQSAGYQYSPEIVSDGSGGAYLVWSDNRSGSEINVFFQQINADGEPLWNTEGLPVVELTGTQQNYHIMTDGSGGAMTVWQDARDSNSDIYTQLINSNLSFDIPVAGTLWAGNKAHTVQWSLRRTQTLFDHIDFYYSETEGDGFPDLIAESINPTQYTQDWTPSGVNSASVRIKAKAFNSDDSLLCEYTSETFTIDSNSPLPFDLVSPLEGAQVELNPVFEWQATTDPLSELMEYQLWIDSDLVQDGLTTTSYTLTPSQTLTSGTHTWTVKAVDMAGLVRQAASVRTFQASEDNDPPLPFHLISPNDQEWTSITNPVFTWEAATDEGEGMLKYRFLLDGDAVIDSIPPNVQAVNSVSLTPGDHTWTIKAIDRCGNETFAVETRTVRMDNVPPKAFSPLQPVNSTWITTTTPLFRWGATTDTSTGVGLEKYQLWIDSALVIDHIPSTETQVQLSESYGLSDGSHPWFVIALDSLGNKRVSSPKFTAQVDRTPPQSFSLVAPEYEDNINTLSPTFSWQAANDELSGLEYYQLWVDGSLDTDLLANTFSPPAHPLIEGQHNWFVRALDEAGNASASPTFLVTLDVSGPESFGLLLPADDAVIHYRQPELVWQSTSDKYSDFKSFSVFLDGKKEWDNLTAEDTTVACTAPLSNGVHTWSVVATDELGNTRTAGPFSFTVQCNPPDITSPSSATGTEDTPFTYTATATDPEGDPLTFSFRNYPAWLTPSGNQISGTPLEGVQNTTFWIKAFDGIYTDSLLVSVVVQPVNDPPVLTSSCKTEATEDVAFSYIASAMDPENSPLAFIFSNYPGWLTPSGNKISGTPTEGITSGSFTVSVSDGFLYDTGDVTLTVHSVNDPPVLTSSLTAQATEDVLFTYTATATDAENSPLTFTFSDYSGWLIPSGNQISGTPAEGITSGSFTITVSDGSLVYSGVVTVTVGLINDPPVLTSSMTAQGTEDILFTYTATATDPENSPLTFTFSDYPDWLTPSGNQISGTPTEGITSGSFKVTVSDGSLEDTGEVAVTVIAVNDPPVLTSSLSAEATEDVLFIYTATATDAENSPLVFTFSNYPQWLAPSGNQISGTPTEGVTAASFEVSVSDGELSDSGEVTVSIGSVNDPPVITSQDTAWVTEDTPFVYTITANDPEQDSLVYVFSEYPSWLVPDGTKIEGCLVHDDVDTLLTVIVSDGQLADTLQVVLKVICTNDAPVITSPDTAYAVEKQLFSYKATAVDEDDSVLTIQFIDYPAWLEPSGVNICGTPSNGVKNTSFKTVATDGELSDTLVVYLFIDPVNDPPYFVYSLPKASYLDIDSLYLDLALDDYVSDPDDPDSTLAWSYECAESGNMVVELDTETRHAIISAEAVTGSYCVVFTVSDPQGTSASDTLRIMVTITEVAALNLVGNAPKEFVLYPNFPNPFNPATTIRYGIPKPCHVSLKVFNMLGQEVSVLIDDEQKTGIYEFEWDAANHPSGIYFVQIRTKTWQQVGRMMLVK